MTDYLRCLGTLKEVLADTPWPVDFFDPEDLPEFLDKIFILDMESFQRDSGLTARVWSAFEGEIALGVPGLDCAKFVIGSGATEGFTFVTATLTIGDES